MFYERTAAQHPHAELVGMRRILIVHRIEQAIRA
jgi:hypothetical protein